MIDTSLLEKINEHAEEIRYQERKARRMQRLKKARRRALIIKCIIVGMLVSLPIGIISVCAAQNTKPQDDFEITQVSESIKPVYSNINVEPETLILDNKNNVTEEQTENFTYDKISLSSADTLLFQQIVMAECYSYFTEEEMLMIASVIRNRVESNIFPDTVREVLTQKKQFETYTNKRYLSQEINVNCEKAVSRALKGDTNIPEDILFFCTKEYYNSCSDDDFFKTLTNVPEYNFRNVMMFKAN
jgi:spore germination cell wall hydrolase CwlJ-like protein